MSYYAYVIYSVSYDRYYKGHCNDLARRIKEHNAGKTRSNKAFRPWRLVYYEVFESREEAISREHYFKTTAGRRFLKKMIKSPEQQEFPKL